MLASISLISPLVYHGSYQPFLTVYDPEFKRLQQNSKTIKNYVIGSTNPLFLKTMHSTHHILYLNKEYENQLKNGKSKSQQKINHLHQPNGKDTLNISASDEVGKMFL